jgi:hypothetical protein
VGGYSRLTSGILLLYKVCRGSVENASCEKRKRGIEDLRCLTGMFNSVELNVSLFYLSTKSFIKISILSDCGGTCL